MILIHVLGVGSFLTAVSVFCTPDKWYNILSKCEWYCCNS